MSDTEDIRPACKYGVDCYQRNQAHKDRFSHPPKDDSTEMDRRSTSPPKPPPKKRRTNTPSPRSEEDSQSDSNDEDEKVEEEDEDKEIEDQAIANSSGNENSPKPVVESPQLAQVKPNAIASAGARCSEFINESFDKGPHAQRVEHQKLLESPADFIKAQFLVEMPSDFSLFWEFCEAESSQNSKPENVFAKIGLKLVGPFDVLAKKFNNIDPFEPGDYLRHWRFYYDPPEFQTILVKEKTGIHYGYWRDEPNGDCLIARNDMKSCEFTFVADNVFAAVLHYIDKDIQLSPFNKPAVLALKKSLEDFAQRKNISLASFSAKLKSRNLKTVCKTFHRAGLAVPFNRKTDVGYRQLGESDANIKKILNKFTEAKGDQQLIMAAMDKLQPLITAANIAVDEGDFGSAVELGTDLFCFGAPELHTPALQLLAIGYKMVNKPQYIAIAKAHLEKRTNGHSDLSILETIQQANK